MKVILFLLALIVAAYAQENTFDSLDVPDALDISMDLDEDDLMLDAAVSDDELELEDAELAEDDPSLGLKRSVEETLEDDSLTAEEEELLRETEQNLEADSQKRQVGNGNVGAARPNFRPRAANLTARFGPAFAQSRFNASMALRRQIGTNQRQRRALHERQLQAIRVLRQKFGADRRTLLQSQTVTRRDLFRKQRNETVAILQSQRADRRRLFQQQTAQLQNTTVEARRVALRVQLRQQRETLRTQQRQARETLKTQHSQQRQSLHLTLQQARETLRSQQTRDRRALATTQVAERAQLRKTIREANAQIRARIRAFRNRRAMQMMSARVQFMARALVQLNVTGLSANTTESINAVGRILTRLQEATNGGNLTVFRASLRNVTAHLLVRLRRLSTSPDLAGTTTRRYVGALIRGVRALRGITPFHHTFGQCSANRPQFRGGYAGRHTGAYSGQRTGSYHTGQRQIGAFAQRQNGVVAQRQVAAVVTPRTQN